MLVAQRVGDNFIHAHVARLVLTNVPPSVDYITYSAHIDVTVLYPNLSVYLCDCVTMTS